ncbi:hypothetical protein [Streptomyces longwoodensis]|uniref:hypothetical protein n=1 Tax=Streptomyces longwoodensis TaxID=68231 RepID=UPI003404823D
MSAASESPPHSSPTPGDLDDPPAGGRVEVRIVSLDPEAARQVADALRLLFAGGEQRSYPAFPSGAGTRLHLTLDAGTAADPLRSWLEASRPRTDRTHPGETAPSAPPAPPTSAGPPAVTSPRPPASQESS